MTDVASTTVAAEVVPPSQSSATSHLLTAKYGAAIRYTANPPNRRAQALIGQIATHWDAGPVADWCEVPASSMETALEGAIALALVDLPNARRIERQRAVHAATPCTREAPHWREKDEA